MVDVEQMKSLIFLCMSDLRKSTCILNHEVSPKGLANTLIYISPRNNVKISFIIKVNKRRGKINQLGYIDKLFTLIFISTDRMMPWIFVDFVSRGGFRSPLSICYTTLIIYKLEHILKAANKNLTIKLYNYLKTAWKIKCHIIS